jgi:hypothetical protein
LFFALALGLALLNKGTSVGHDILAVPPPPAASGPKVPGVPSTRPAVPPAKPADQAPKVPMK